MKQIKRVEIKCQTLDLIFGILNMFAYSALTNKQVAKCT